MARTDPGAPLARSTTMNWIRSIWVEFSGKAMAQQWAVRFYSNDPRFEIAERTARVMISCLGVDMNVIKPSDSFNQDLPLDDLADVDLAVCLEQEFGLELPGHETVRLDTVGDLVNYMCMKMGILNGYRD